MNNRELLSTLRHGVIVSCQALADEPLHSPFIMSKMALAAKMGGAVGIRANGGADIQAIRAQVALPIIGIVKKHYADSEIYITPTLSEVEEVVDAGAEIVSVDATARRRPGGLALAEFYRSVRKKYPQVMLMADVSTAEEGKAALRMGFELVSTTLCGYTTQTKGEPLPACNLLRELSEEEGIVLIAEGGIWSPEDLCRAFESGAFAAVIGTAITRPRDITRRFVDAAGGGRPSAD